MKRGWLAAALVLAGGAARGDFLVSHASFLFGERTNLGDLGARYNPGVALGIEAGVAHSWLGLVWAFEYSHFWSSDSGNVDDTLNIYELDLGLRASLHPKPDWPAYLFVQSGVNLVRYSIPVIADGGRNFLGPSLGAGVEWAPATLRIGLCADYGLLFGGPSGVKLLIFLGMSGD